MRTAGFEPRTRLRTADLGDWFPTRRPASWEHHCPVCQTARLARRAVRRWRCRPCVEAGLSGELRIRKLAP